MADSTPLIDQSSKKKQGHRVLCCCDSRKAAILVSLVALVLSILALISAALPQEGVPVNATTIATLSVSLLFYLLVVWGAIKFHRCACIVSLLWEVISLGLIIAGTAMYDWSSISGQEKESAIAGVAIIMIWKVFVIYALGTFVREVRSGIMSPETHSREKYSCCCNV